MGNVWTGFTAHRRVAGGNAPPLHIADGTLEALKWTAAALMLLDHVNTFLYNRTLPGVYELGRWVAPVFAFVLAYNLARPGALERGVYLRLMRRLAIFGLLAAPPLMALIGRWWPLNIMLLLLAATAVIYGLERRDGGGIAIAGCAFCAGGLLAEYFYPGLVMVVAAWAYCREPNGRRLLVWVLSVAMLMLINANFWALAAVPCLLLATRVDLRLPRLRWLFYAFYPLHLAALWCLRDGHKLV
jgi:TraX protein